MTSMGIESAFDDEYDYVEEFDALAVNVKKSKPVKYPAKLHAHSVVKHLGVKTGLIYLPGQPEQDIPDSDQPLPFRQRRYFFYLSGANFENCALTYDIGADFLTLFIPTADPKEVVWLGPVPTIAECQIKYDVDRVAPNSTLRLHLNSYLQKTKDPKIYLLHDSQFPPGLNIPGEIFNTDLLLPAIDAARVIKSPYEIAQIRHANAITGKGFRAVLARVAKLSNETQIEAIFQAVCVSKGAKRQAYGIIAGSGANASTLHYDANNEPLKDHQLVVMDAGCEWDCYASDVTRTFPISGEWTKEAKQIYDIVDKIQSTVLKNIGPGVVYRDLHILSFSMVVRGLLELGILHNGTFAEVYDTGVAFYPHGLGHHLGLECHDVIDTQRLLSGFETHHDLQRQKTFLPMNTLKSLETNNMTGPPPYTARQTLLPGMVVTVEPGIYFSRYALEKYWLKIPRHAKYIDTEVLEKYYAVGGVRIEDDILIKSGGWENLTTAPRGDEALKIIRGEVKCHGEDLWL